MILLDTHALLWYLTAPKLLSGEATRVIRGALALAVSAASLWEVATKYRCGNLPFIAPLMEHGFLGVLRVEQILVLPVGAAEAMHAGLAPAVHADRFDRMIAAHALLRSVPLVSNDARLDDFGITRIW